MLVGTYLFIFFNFLLSILSLGNGANILATFPFTGISNSMFFTSLLQELARRGHNVTVIGPFSFKTNLTNYRQYPFGSKLDLNITNTFTLRADTHSYKFLYHIYRYSLRFCQTSFKVPEINKFIKGEEKVDLYISTAFFSECHLGFLHVYKDIPFIQMIAFGGYSFMLGNYGNPLEIATVPSPTYEYNQYMTFFERFRNYFTSLLWTIYRTGWHIPLHQKLLYEYFGADVPPIEELQKRSSLFFLNSEAAFGVSRAYSPNIQPVGGMHIVNFEPLGKDLEKWINESTHGVIYFSLGSSIRSIDMPKHIIKSFIYVFSQLNQRVLWKWEHSVLENKPPNVRIEKWVPQKTLLGHPKIVAFVSHGGLLSVQETVYHGVPILGFPLMTDMNLNMRMITDKKIGISMDFENITIKSLKWGIDEIVNNSIYRKQAQHYSKLFRDNLVHPLERAVYYVEYVLRHKGAAHLENPAKHLFWYQRTLFDIHLSAIIILLVSIFITHILCKKCYKYLYSKNLSNDERQQQPRQPKPRLIFNYVEQKK